jgi:hypothetical protein
MTPTRQQVIRELHPEVSLREMTAGRLAHGKKTLAGERERERVAWRG